MGTSRPIVAVIGPNECEPFIATMAEELGKGIAEMGAALVTGGRGGVMQAASKGAKAAEGLVIGVLPGPNRAAGNPYLDIALPTNLGQARNPLIVQMADVVIAVGGGYGTLSEIGHALKIGKLVIGLATWEIPGVDKVESPEAALLKAGNEIAAQLSGA